MPRTNDEFSFESEVIDAQLPRKAAKLQVI